MRVLFAPDRENSVSEAAGRSFKQHGVEVSFLSDCRRGLSLFRGTRTKAPDEGIARLVENGFFKNQRVWQ